MRRDKRRSRSRSRRRSRSKSKSCDRTSKKLKSMQDQINNLTEGWKTFCSEFKEAQSSKNDDLTKISCKENESNDPIEKIDADIVSPVIEPGQDDQKSVKKGKGIDVEFLAKLGEKITSSEDGIKIDDGVKDWWKDWMQKGIDEDSRAELLKKYPRKGDFYSEAPEVNLSVAHHVTGIAKKRDQHFIDTQNCVGSAIIALASAFSLGMADDDSFDFASIMQRLWDAGKILGDVFSQQSNCRKAYVTPLLDKEIRPTLNSTRQFIVVGVQRKS